MEIYPDYCFSIFAIILKRGLMSIFINRTLNMKTIKAIGFDMDYTLVRYNTAVFDEYTFYAVIEKLISEKNYPAGIRSFKYDVNKSIQGLVIDKKEGNTLKLNRFGKVKMCFHGTQKIDFRKQREIYGPTELDLNDPNIQSLDTSFALCHGILFGELVEFKKSNNDSIPDYPVINQDIKEMLDIAHQDGTLKDEVRRDLGKYIIQDPELPSLLENYKDHGIKLLVITNSDYNYTKLLLDYTITPFLKKNQSWSDLFEITITQSQKPKFFTDNVGFLKVDPDTGLMSNYNKKLVPGIYQGGNAEALEKSIGLHDDEILYLGDHIYGDVVSIKKTFQWRTALVIEPLLDELDSMKQSLPYQQEIDVLMDEKFQIEKMVQKHRECLTDQSENDEKLLKMYDDIEKLNKKISGLISKYQNCFNPYWGELMRAGYEESRLAGQIEKYACIYMTKVSDLIKLSPRSYFRPVKRILAHEHDIK